MATIRHKTDGTIVSAVFGHTISQTTLGDPTAAADATVAFDESTNAHILTAFWTQGLNGFDCVGGVLRRNGVAASVIRLKEPWPQHERGEHQRGDGSNGEGVSGLRHRAA